MGPEPLHLILGMTSQSDHHKRLKTDTHHCRLDIGVESPEHTSISQPLYSLRTR